MASRPYFPVWLRRAIFTRDDHACAYCGRSIYEHAIALQVEHIQPWCLEPDRYYDFDNLITSCATCNRAFGGKRKPAAVESAALALAARRNREGNSIAPPPRARPLPAAA